MKITELRILIDKYSQDQLKAAIIHLYKALPKATKEGKDIDNILNNPDSLTQPKPKIKPPVELPDIDELEYDISTFIEDAYKQYYFAPNQFVSKHDRPKWRFMVKGFYRDLLLLSAAGDENNLLQVSQLMEKLYQLLCYSSGYVLFNSSNPFRSAGIEQPQFFRQVLVFKRQTENNETFVKSALLLLINNSLDRETLHQDLMQVVMEFLKTPDLREMAVTACNQLIESKKREPRAKKDSMSDYERERYLNNLARMGFLVYAQLREYDKAITYFKQNYQEKDSEISLYVLLELLFSLDQKDYLMREYETALNNGIAPRKELSKTYQLTKTNGKLPEHFAWSFNNIQQ